MKPWYFPDARGWIGIGIYAMSIQILWMIAIFPDLRSDEFFKTIATLVIGTGFIGGVVSWAFAATKGGGEAAESSARIAEQAATAAIAPLSGVQDVRVTNPASDPVPVETK